MASSKSGGWLDCRQEASSRKGVIECACTVDSVGNGDSDNTRVDSELFVPLGSSRDIQVCASVAWTLLMRVCGPSGLASASTSEGDGSYYLSAASKIYHLWNRDSQKHPVRARALEHRCQDCGSKGSNIYATEWTIQSMD